MIYPKFIKPGDTIGITAPSDGFKKEIDFVRLQSGKEHFNELGFSVIETKNTRTSLKGKSSSGQERASELETLFENPEVSYIVAAKGGDYLVEMLSYLDLKKLKERPAWVQGYSDTTGLTFTITTNLDMATVYGCNFSDFGMKEWHRALTDNIQMLQGKELVQESFDLYEDDFYDRETGLEGYTLTTPVKWRVLTDGTKVYRHMDGSIKEEEKVIGECLDETSNQLEPNVQEDKIPAEKSMKDVVAESETTQEMDEFTGCLEMKGRVLCGCFDALLNLIGTRFDKTKEFVEKYQEDGILWLLESFDLSSESMLRGLWQLKEAGWFKGTTGFVFGRPAMTRNFTNTSYDEAVLMALEELKVPIILDADLGHRSPQMTVINGSIGEVRCENGKGKMVYHFK